MPSFMPIHYQQDPVMLAISPGSDYTLLFILYPLEVELRVVFREGGSCLALILGSAAANHAVCSSPSFMATENILPHSSSRGGGHARRWASRRCRCFDGVWILDLALVNCGSVARFAHVTHDLSYPYPVLARPPSIVVLFWSLFAAPPAA
ncbi:hypothetical protein EJ08DRAFT_393451 [Tothia fuscella]|uniref:Uncharacterized protein n=1 Tax=Tothia fuscella TaxID=1048955 RepID=A0A9P4P1H5_9PEZI|nr:hypothetical protein EJ08DRAFT_393451 [Tothia fuscella]